MKYVLDASVAVRWVLRDLLQAKARQLRTAYQNSVHELLAPDIFIAEVAGALTKAERQKIIRVGDAALLYDDVMKNVPVLHSYIPLVSRAIDISSQTRSALYDCLYVALAEREGCQMVTADDKLLRNIQPFFPFVVPLATLP
jgi:predicted nucleic acid-binding protein